MHLCPTLFIIHTGFQCENHENPADFFLDTLNRSEKEQNHAVIYRKDDKGMSTGYNYFACIKGRSGGTVRVNTFDGAFNTDIAYKCGRVHI